MKKSCFIIFSILLLITSTICSVFTNNKIVYADDVPVDAKACLLVDYNTDTVLFENNQNARFPIASMVKLMTILLTYEEIEAGNLTLDTMITTSENASGMGGSQVFIDPYVEYKTEDLLRSVIMASANDASVALAEQISGSEEVFVSKMNKRAKELGMNNTVYVNCTGLPAPEQYSCASDCAKILKKIISFEHYHTISTTWMDTLTHPSGRTTELVNTNKLVRYYKGCDSGKTGSTNEAGYCLTASAIRGDFRLIAVVIGAKTSQDRFSGVSNLFNYGFANFENKMLIDSELPILKGVQVIKSKTNIVDLYAKESYFGLCKKGDNSGYSIEYNINEIKAPLKSNSVVGFLTITKNGQVIKNIELITKQDLEVISYFDGIKKIANEW